MVTKILIRGKEYKAVVGREQRGEVRGVLAFRPLEQLVSVESGKVVYERKF
jgi:hypothetical protein